MVEPTRPDKAVRSLAALRRWGPTPAAAYTGSAIRYPDRIAVADERGTLTFAEVHRRTNALAHELARPGRRRGRRRGDHVPQPPRLRRRHRRPARSWAPTALYLNTAFAGPQITDVLAREDAEAVIYDEEFAGLLRDGAANRLRFVAWSESPLRPG